MTKIEAINLLKTKFIKMLEDGMITPNEINEIQDWIDENGVLLVGEEYNKIILPLQQFIEDGEYSDNEISRTLSILESI